MKNVTVTAELRNSIQKASIKAAKILANGFGRGFSPKEFGEYVEDYFNNPEEYNIDIESDYYKAIETAWEQIADTFRRPVWQSTTVQASPVYKYYINKK
jgi:hypothetical protein